MDKPAAAQWLKGIQHAESCMNAVMSIISPELYKNSLAVIEHIQANHEDLFDPVPESRENNWPHPTEALMAWPSVFTGMAVITNRLTPSHRDDHGHHPWYDLLFSGGRHTAAQLKVVDLGATFSYKPGTLVALCGRTFRHQCMDYVGDDRICVAHYMRYDVMDRLNISAKDPDWVLVKPLLDLCNEKFKEDNGALYTLDFA